MSALLSACRRGGPVLHWLLKNLTNSCSCALPSSKSLENFFPPALSGRDRERRCELERARDKHLKLILLRTVRDRHLSASWGSRCCRCQSSWRPAVSPSGPRPRWIACTWTAAHWVPGADAKETANDHRRSCVIREEEVWLFLFGFSGKTVLLTTNSATILDRRYALDSTGALGKKSHQIVNQSVR